MSKTMEELAEEQHAKDRAKSQMGRNAAELLANPVWAPTWEWLRSSIMESWAKSNPQDAEEQLILHTQIKVLGWVKDRLESLVRAGEVIDDEQRRRIMEAEAEEAENVFTRGLRRMRR